MYTLSQSMPFRRFLLEQGVPLTLSFIIAELFYKFHSFTLECLAFLVTWYIFDFLIQSLRRRPAEETSNKIP
jgi:hypothetical protein